MGAKRNSQKATKTKKPNSKKPAETAKNEDAELEAALAAIEASDGDSEKPAAEEPKVKAEAVEEVVDDESGEDLSPESVEAALANLEKEEAKKPKKTASKSKETKPAGEKKSKAEETVPARSFHDIAAIKKPAFEKNREDMAKKVGEKADNVVQAVERGKKLSRYTADAVKLLSKEGQVSAKAMCDAFIAANLSVGTARAQSQQMTALFKGIGLCEAGADKSLTVKDQALLDELVKLAA